MGCSPASIRKKILHSEGCQALEYKQKVPWRCALNCALLNVVWPKCHTAPEWAMRHENIEERLSGGTGTAAARRVSNLWL